MTPPEREARILSLKPLVEMLAALRHRSVPARVGLDELVSAAWLGAIQAVDRFDPARDTKLDTYARWKIRSAMIDYLRSLDPLSRQHRKEVARGDAAAPFTFSISPMRNIDPSDDKPAALACIADARATRSQAALDARIALHNIYPRAQLRARNALVLKRYMEGETMTSIGASIGVSEGRISQLCFQAIAKLRAAA